MGKTRPLLKIEGARRLQSTLKAAGDEIDVGDALKPAFMQAAAVAAGRARAIAPVRSGWMRDTIGPGATKRGGIIRAGFKKTAPYAGVINYGTPNTTGRPANITGAFYMQKGATETEPTWTPIVFKAVEDILKTIKGK